MENNGRGIFYGVIGVATLIVAIVGATFAFFTATASNDKTVTGTAATAGLDLKVEKVSTDATNGLIPLLETDAPKALMGDTATSSKICVDKNGNTVCQVYKITVTNTGTATALLDGSLTLTAAGYTNLKWALMTSASEVGTNFKASSVTELAKADSYAAAGTKDYYVMIYINETNANQNTTDTGNFTGVVTFNSAAGANVTASFSA